MIIAIDPGSARSACVAVEYGHIKRAFIRDNQDVADFIIQHDATDAAVLIEHPVPRGQLSSSHLFETIRWIGDIVATVRLRNEWQCPYPPPYFIDRMSVKMSICGRATASDAAIRAALIDLYTTPDQPAVGTKKKPGPLYGLKADLWQAFALAQTWMNGDGREFPHKRSES